jgi:hypothetical protein
VRLAVSRNSSNSPDWKDLADILNAFQGENGLTVNIKLSPVVTGTTTDIRLEAVWWTLGQDYADRRHSDYLSVTCLATNRKSLEAAILALLYQLDFKLALSEYDAVIKKR